MRARGVVLGHEPSNKPLQLTNEMSSASLHSSHSQLNAHPLGGQEARSAGQAGRGWAGMRPNGQ